MNRQHRSTTVGSDDSPPREIPEEAFSQGSPLARRRTNRRRSTLHDILERTKKQQQGDGGSLHNRNPSTSGAEQEVPETRPAPLQIPTASRPLPAFTAHSLPPDSGMVSARAVHKAELQFRLPSPPTETQQSLPGPRGLASQPRRPSPMHRRSGQGFRAQSMSRNSRESMELGSATPHGSWDRLAPLSTKRSGEGNPYRVERRYRIVDRTKDSDSEQQNALSSDGDATPSSSPLSGVFPLPPVQPPPPPKDLPPLPRDLQKQLKQLPRLSPPRKLPLNNKPVLQLGLPEPGLAISPGPGSRGSDRRVVSGSSILRSPSKASFNDTQSTQNMHLGSHPPVSAKIGKGQASEMFRRVGYWLYSTAPVQFIKHAMVEERNDSVNVLFSTERSIWILGVSYRMKKNSKRVMLPVALEADSSHLQMDSSLFLTHHHQRRSGSPTRAPRARKLDPAPQRRSEDIPGNRRRANTSGVMANKKKLQSIAQLQNYPGVPALPEPGTPGILSAAQGLRTLASIPSQDLLRPRQPPGEPISPLPFPDDLVAEATNASIQETSTVNASAPSTRKSSFASHLQLQQQQQNERPKSSKMGRLRSWVARTAKPMRRKSDIVAENAARDGSAAPLSTVGLSMSRPSSPPLRPRPLRTSQTSRLSNEALSPLPKGVPRTSTGSSSMGLGVGGLDPKMLGIGSPGGAGLLLRRKSKEALSVLSGASRLSDGARRSHHDSDMGFQHLPPIPHLQDHNAPPATAGVNDRIPSARYAGVPGGIQRRPRSSHSNAASQSRIASSSSSSHMSFGPTRQESAVRSLVSDFAAWESPAASIMMFQREWKLPSFQQLVTVQSATAWAKESGWTVTLSSETFFMGYIFYNLPSDAASLHGPVQGEKISGDRLLLRMRLAMEDIEGKVLAGESWRDTITAIILTIDARVAPKCANAAVPKRNFSQGSGHSSEQSTQPKELSPDDHIKRMKILEKHLAKVTESFSNHFWPRQEDHVPVFNTYPRHRTGEGGNGAFVEKRPSRRARGWNMIPTLLTFKSNRDKETAQIDKSPTSAPCERPDSPTLSVYTRKRHLYPMGLSIASNSDNQGASIASSHDMSTVDSGAATPDRQSPVQSRSPSRPASPLLTGQGPLSLQNRCSGYSHFSNGRPASPVYKRGTLGLYSNNDVSTLTEEFGQSLGLGPRPPAALQSTSSRSSGASSGFNLNSNLSATSIISRQPTGVSISPTGQAQQDSQQQDLQQQDQQQQRKRKAGEAGVVGKTKGGFEVVWTSADAMSTSYVMVPVPKAAAPESPTKMLKQHHSRASAVAESEANSTQSQPNLKRVLESITREINLDSSYVLLLPPPPPINMHEDEDVDEDDEFGYLSTMLLRRAKSEIAMRRTLQEFEHERGLDLPDVDGNDTDSFQMIDSDDSSRNSVYFSAEDDAAMEPETWYKRLSGSSSQHHLPQRYRQQPMYSDHDVAPRRPQPLSLNQLTLLELFMDGMRRFYFTYRKGFPTITPSFYTSDMGWGCTYRTCQMMLAESFARVMLGRFWDPFRLGPSERTRHARIIEWFHDADTQQAFYSIHRMARTATEMDKRIGDWLGPSIAAHVMKRLSIKHPNCPLMIHVAIDQTVYASEVRKQAMTPFGASPPAWRPLLLLVPVRLGLSRLNLGYIPKIKTLFQIPQCVGLVGGKPSRSFYFIGRQSDNLFYLDPHVTRQHMPQSGTLDGEQVVSDSDSDTSDYEVFGIEDTDEYHTTHMCTMPIHRLDPSMLLGFLFNTEAEWDTFVMAATDKESQRSICTGTSPLFTLLSGSSMMTPHFDSVAQPALGSGKGTSPPSPELGGGRKSPRVNSDPQVHSPRLAAHPPSELPISCVPPLTRGRSASSPRFPTADVNALADFSADEGDDDEFEML
ncbi:hypothetical protein GGF46_000189 [Coemansia sp. RSA 552]|nr:hypothetical protein GGF46_000189 [Coemansia sp. RSA 552]